MMNDYYEKSMRALKLAGMSKSTQECYGQHKTLYPVGL